MFAQTQRNLANFVLIKYFADIQKNFGVDWTSVQWQDLRKPLYSALAAYLYVCYKSRMSDEAIPQTIEDQARFWRSYYRPNGTKQHFNTMAMKFENRTYKCVVVERGTQ